MEESVIAINFCGGCNPEIDRGELALRIRDALDPLGVKVTFNDWSAAFIVRLSGCKANCALKYHPDAHPDAVVAGLTFDAVAVAEERLADLVVAAVAEHFRIDMTSKS